MCIGASALGSKRAQAVAAIHAGTRQTGESLLAQSPSSSLGVFLMHMTDPRLQLSVACGQAAWSECAPPEGPLSERVGMALQTSNGCD